MRKTTLTVMLFVPFGVLGLAVLMAGANPRANQDPVEELKKHGSLVILKKLSPIRR